MSLTTAYCATVASAAVLGFVSEIGTGETIKEACLTAASFAGVAGVMCGVMAVFAAIGSAF